MVRLCLLHYLNIITLYMFYRKLMENNMSSNQKFYKTLPDGTIREVDTEDINKASFIPYYMESQNEDFQVDYNDGIGTDYYDLCHESQLPFLRSRSIRPGDLILSTSGGEELKVLSITGRPIDECNTIKNVYEVRGVESNNKFEVTYNDYAIDKGEHPKYVWRPRTMARNKFGFLKDPK